MANFFDNIFGKSRMFNIAGVYLGISMGVMHFTEMVFPAIHLPEYSINIIIILSLIGLPITLLLSWATRRDTLIVPTSNSEEENSIAEIHKFNWWRISFSVTLSLLLMLTTIAAYNIFIFPRQNELNKEIIGLYNGKSLNKSGYKIGGTYLDIKELDCVTGKIRAEVGWYNGLYGTGSLFGSIANENIELHGTIESEIGSWDIDLAGRLSNNSDTISGFYRLFAKPGNLNGTQDGEFIVIKKKPSSLGLK